MKHISILIPRGAAALGCIEGAYRMFTQCNDFLLRRDRPALFNVRWWAFPRRPGVRQSLYRAARYCCIRCAKTDLIIIPAVNGVMEEVIDINKDFLPWIRGQYRKERGSSEFMPWGVSSCVHGLVKERQIATHWLSVNDFRDVPGCEPGKRPDHYRRAGNLFQRRPNSFWNLLLHIVEKYTDREIAIILCAKYFAIEIDRSSQSSFLMFRGQKEHDDDPIREIQTYIEENYREKITVDQLASQFAISRRSLERRFKKRPATPCPNTSSG